MADTPPPMPTTPPQASRRGLTIGYCTVAAIALAELLLPLPANARSEAMLRLATSVLLMLVAARPIWLVIRRVERPLGQFLAELRRHRAAIAWTLVTYAALAVALETGTAIKKSIPQLNPFWADPALIALDRAVFGTDPWRLTHALFGWATPAMAQAYMLWQSVQIGLALWIAFSLDEAAKIRFALLFQLTWLLNGGVLALTLASVGPIMVGNFYPDQSFAPLLTDLKAIAPFQLAVRDYLVGSMDDPSVISGISAMPSMHVAISLIAALWLRRFRRRWVSLVGWAYLALIYVSSVHLGWHYASDGMVSAAVVLTLYWLTGKYVDRLTDASSKSAKAYLPATQSVAKTSPETPPVA